MGYSCTKAASEMLGLIRNQFSDGVTGNGLRFGGSNYFYEVGRENVDGAITGSVFEHIDETHARKVGSFRIAPDGHIPRFPRIKRDMMTSMYFMFLELLRTDPAMLSLYSQGAI
jgi:hypothetical protein